MNVIFPIKNVNIHNATSIQNFLNPAEEHIKNQTLTNDKILAVAGKENEEDELQEEAEADVSSAYSNILLKDRVITLAQVLSFVEDNKKCLEPSLQEMARGLKGIQKRLRLDI
jgi:hypothetical protein